MPQHDIRDKVTVGECKPLAAWLRLCAIDLITVVTIAVFIWYVVWGVPMTIKFVKWCKSKYATQTKVVPERPPVLHDAEKGSNPSCDLSTIDRDDADRCHDPYMSPSRKLYNYLRQERSPTALQPIYIASRSRSGMDSLEKICLGISYSAAPSLSPRRLSPSLLSAESESLQWSVLSDSSPVLNKLTGCWSDGPGSMVPGTACPVPPLVHLHRSVSRDQDARRV